MSTAKENVIQLIQNMPDESSYDEILAEISFRQNVEDSLQQIESGETVSHEEVKKRMAM